MESVNNKQNEFVRQVAEQKYEFGFTTDVHTDIIDKGLTEDTVRLISAKKGEPEWMLDFRLKAFRHWLTMEQPAWGHVHLPEIDYQAISYYADPMAKKKDEGKKEIDPELMKTFDKLGIPLEERLILSGQTAVDAIMDSVSVKTTYKEKLAEKGIIFCSIGDAVKNHPDLVLSRQLLRRVEQRSVQRRLVRLHTEGRAKPDGAKLVFPHQRKEHGTVRTHANHRRGRQLRVLP